MTHFQEVDRIQSFLFLDEESEPPDGWNNFLKVTRVKAKTPIHGFGADFNVLFFLQQSKEETIFFMNGRLFIIMLEWMFQLIAKDMSTNDWGLKDIFVFWLCGITITEIWI